MEESVEAAKRKGRSARFAVRVVSEYRYTCALTGYRCLTSDGATIVDAAHIEQWAKTQNDDPANGLALSKNAHWMLDEGLWTGWRRFACRGGREPIQRERAGGFQVGFICRQAFAV